MPILRTPNRRTDNAECGNDEMVLVNTKELSEMIGEIVEENLKVLEVEYESNMTRFRHDLLIYMSKKLQELKGQVRYMQGRHFQSDFNHRFKYHMTLEDELLMFDEGFAAFFHLDSVEEQHPIYAAELEDLRRQFQNQQNQKPH